MIVFKHSILSLLLTAVIFSCTQSQWSTPFWDDESSPEKIGQMAVDDLLAREEIMRYETDFLSTVHYAEAIAGMGAMELASLQNDTSRVLKLKERYQGILDNFESLPANHVDANVIGVIPFQFYRWNGNKNYRRMGIEMADIQWENPQPDGLSNQTRYWIDDMYMIVIIQKKAYQVTGDTIYLERAALQMDDYLEKLQQSNGLFHHGPEAPFFWGRGNGWMAVALAELIEVLPPENEHYRSIVGRYKTMMESLVEYQAADGMWRQLIDHDEAWKESSGTAMFGYSIKLGVDAGLLSDATYKKAYQKTWLALVERINKEGKLTNICVGTGQSDDIQYYLNRPTVDGDLHGQAPLLWFAHSLLETDS